MSHDDVITLLCFVFGAFLGVCACVVYYVNKASEEVDKLIGTTALYRLFQPSQKDKADERN